MRPPTSPMWRQCLGSRDGREIVLALDALRSKSLDRDGEGRYFIKPA
jgi:hypothetical protein